MHTHTLNKRSTLSLFFIFPFHFFSLLFCFITFFNFWSFKGVERDGWNPLPPPPPHQKQKYLLNRIHFLFWQYKRIIEISYTTVSVHLWHLDIKIRENGICVIVAMATLKWYLWWACVRSFRRRKRSYLLCMSYSGFVNTILRIRNFIIRSVETSTSTCKTISTNFSKYGLWGQKSF